MSDAPKIHVKNPTVNDHSLFFPGADVRIPLSLMGIFSYSLHCIQEFFHVLRFFEFPCFGFYGLLPIVRAYNQPCVLRVKNLMCASTHHWVSVSLMIDSIVYLCGRLIQIVGFHKVVCYPHPKVR